jgi:hypothetical protein
MRAARGHEDISSTLSVASISFACSSLSLLIRFDAAFCFSSISVSEMKSRN